MRVLVEMPRGFVTDSFLNEENVALLESLGEVIWNTSDQHLTPTEFRDALADVDVCVCGWGVPRFDEYVLEKANNLKVIASSLPGEVVSGIQASNLPIKFQKEPP